MNSVNPKLAGALILLLAAISSPGFAQDLIYKKDHSLIQAKVIEVKEETVRFKRNSRVKGPILVESKSNLIKIVFESGSEIIFDPIENQKLESTSPRNDGKTGKKSQETKHAIYAEALGLGGFGSANYQILLEKDEPTFGYGRIGIGFSDASIIIPHGFSMGYGNETHQLEIGLYGALVKRIRKSVYPSGDELSFLYGRGPLKYSISPSIGYRFQGKSGFFANVQIPVIIAFRPLGRDVKGYHDLTGYWVDAPAWQAVPWPGAGIGFAF